MRRVGGAAWGAVRLGVLTAGLAAGLVGTALADDLRTVGAWTAFRTKTSDGTALCGIKTILSGGREFYVKWYTGYDHLTVHMFEEGWKIPAGTAVTVTLTLSGNPAVTFPGVPRDEESSLVEFSISKTTIRSFVRQASKSATATVEFEGNEPDWRLDMSGSEGALAAMAECADGIASPAASETPLTYLRRPVPQFGAPTQSTGPQPVAR